MNQMNDGAPLWEVVSIQDGTAFTSQGPRPAKEVYIKVMGDVSTKILIPDSEFSADKVNDMAHKLAVEIVRSLSLRHDMPMQQEQFNPYQEQT